MTCFAWHYSNAFALAYIISLQNGFPLGDIIVLCIILIIGLDGSRTKSSFLLRIRQDFCRVSYIPHYAKIAHLVYHQHIPEYRLKSKVCPPINTPLRVCNLRNLGLRVSHPFAFYALTGTYRVEPLLKLWLHESTYDFCRTFFWCFLLLLRPKKSTPKIAKYL